MTHSHQRSFRSLALLTVALLLSCSGDDAGVQAPPGPFRCPPSTLASVPGHARARLGSDASARIYDFDGPFLCTAQFISVQCQKAVKGIGVETRTFTLVLTLRDDIAAGMPVGRVLRQGIDFTVRGIFARIGQTRIAPPSDAVTMMVPGELVVTIIGVPNAPTPWIRVQGRQCDGEFSSVSDFEGSGLPR